jgi:Zn-dependent alcohol dehydrogenase
VASRLLADAPAAGRCRPVREQRAEGGVEVTEDRRPRTMNKSLLGSIFGSYSPRAAIPEILSMYQAGMLDLDSLVTKKYRLEQVNEGYADLLNGSNIRGLIEFD